MKQLHFLFFMGFFSITHALLAQRDIERNYCYDNSIQNADINKFSPITVNVNAIVLHKDDGSGTFKLLGSDQESIDQSTVFMDYLDHTNHIYSTFVQPASYNGCDYTGTEFFSDFKIRIKNNVIPISDTYYWNYKNDGNTTVTPTQTWYIKPLDDVIHNSPNYPKAINTYYTQDGSVFDLAVSTNGAQQSSDTYAASQFPDSNNLERSSQTHVPNRFIKYLNHKYQAPIIYGTTWNETRNWHISDSRGGVAHELGHSFGLVHVNNCQDNLMKQGHNHAKNFLTPTQIRTAHDKLTNTNLIQFVTEDSYYKVGLRITQNQTWTTKRRIYSDLIIENGTNLIIKKDLIMPPQSRIYIRNGGTLTLDGGLILSADGKNWGGLYKNPTGNFVVTANTNSGDLYDNEYFQVIITSSNTTICNSGIGIGNKENNLDESLVIFPNPSDGNVSLELLDTSFIGGEMHIYDNMNKTVFNKNFISSKENFNLSKLPKGIYTVVVSKNGKNYDKKLIIK